MTVSHAPRRRSRVHAANHVLQELRRIRVKLELAAEFRTKTPEEYRWCLQTADVLDKQIQDGERSLPPFRDPRPLRRVRKRAPKPGLFATVP
jgi:hypothetical protein